MCAYVRGMGIQTSSEARGLGPPAAGGLGGYEPADMAARTGSRPSARALCAPNC